MRVAIPLKRLYFLWFQVDIQDFYNVEWQKKFLFLKEIGLLVGRQLSCQNYVTIMEHNWQAKVHLTPIKRRFYAKWF